MSEAFLTIRALSAFFSAQPWYSESSWRASVRVLCMQTVALVAVTPPLRTSSSQMSSPT